MAAASISNSSINDDVDDMLLSQLPEEVVSHILTWLPVSSLVRFKLVCKSWYSLIKSSSFIAQHKDNGKDNGDNLIVMEYFRRHNGRPKDCACTTCLYGGCFTLHSSVGDKKFHELSETLDWCCLEDTLRGVKGMMSFNGVICLFDVHRSIALWNPALRQSRVLPELIIPPLQYIYLGFGFDVKHNDYKVVRLSKVKTHIDLYCLSTDSWRSLDYNLDWPLCLIVSDPKRPCCNGGIYCWLAGHKNGEYRILIFDFCNEVFSTISLPSTIQHCGNLCLDILKENIACIKGSNISLKTKAVDIEIWVMKEFGVKESWIKLYRFTQSSSFCKPMGFPKNGEFLLLVKDSKDKNQLYLSNLVSQKLENLPFEGGFIVRKTVFKESLVSVEREKGTSRVQTSDEC